MRRHDLLFSLDDQTEQRLGFRPRFGTFDAAFDRVCLRPFYRENQPDFGFAAVPFSRKATIKPSNVSSMLRACHCAKPAGDAGEIHFTDRTKCIIEHDAPCIVSTSILSTNAPKLSSPSLYLETRGCTAQMPTSIGARLRYTLDLTANATKNLSERTATERINSQAVALGIERPHLRNGQAIATRIR